MRVAVVTPYYKEPEAWLARCLTSVREQTYPATHFVVADGHPQAWVDEAGVRHLKLDQSHADYGNTPRTLGAMLAVGEGYDAIAFLDGDNWYAPDHIERCVQVAREQEVDFVTSRRHWARADGSIINVNVAEDDDGSLSVAAVVNDPRRAFATIAAPSLPRPPDARAAAPPAPAATTSSAARSDGAPDSGATASECHTSPA